MPLTTYGLLRGAVINVLPFKKIGDHYNIEIRAAGKLYRIAVDVYSTLKGSPKSWSADGSTQWDTDRLVMFYKDEQYTHPILIPLLQAAEGLTPGAALPAPLHPDYVRYQPALFPLDQMVTVPPKQSDKDGNDLNDDIDPWIQKAKNNAQAEVFAFGSSWDDSTDPHPDPHQYFHPNPSLGIHDIHMNQGDSGSQGVNNGAGQDGALFIRFAGAANAGNIAGAKLGPTAGNAAAGSADADTWVAMFFRFQNQSIDTDAQGNPV
jgi:uncharacterized protein YukJ